MEPGKEMTWLPEQDEEKLQLGFRIIQNAFKGKVSALENEIRALKHANEEKQANLTAVQKKNSALEVEIIETHQRAQTLSEENKTLLGTVRQLRKQIEKLDRLKKTFMDTMEHYNTDPNSGGGVEDPGSLMHVNEDYLRGAVPLSVQDASGFTPARPAAPAPYAPTYSQTTPAAGLGGMGPMPGGMGGLGGSPMGAATPGTGISAPGSPQIDGKAFFRAARGKLSYENFNAFLANIKRLNNHQQNREQTLEEAKRLFGPGNGDLYNDFQMLLNRHS
jgi:hypothetical protein